MIMALSSYLRRSFQRGSLGPAWIVSKGILEAASSIELGRGLYRATPTEIRDLGLNGLIRKTGTHVPQWGSNPQLKDHQILEPDDLTTAPRGRLPRKIESNPSNDRTKHEGDNPSCLDEFIK